MVLQKKKMKKFVLDTLVKSFISGAVFCLAPLNRFAPSLPDERFAG
jgi:hypothetical protein